MPQVTVYIRQGDIEQWKAIEKKSEFIHDALIMAKLPPEVLKSPRIKMAGDMGPLTIEPPKKPENIKVNDDNTISPIDPKQPSSFTTEIPAPKQPEPSKFPPSAASQMDVIKTPEQAKKIVENPQFIDKKYSARKPGSRERHVEL